MALTRHKRLLKLAPVFHMKLAGFLHAELTSTCRTCDLAEESDGDDFCYALLWIAGKAPCARSARSLSLPQPRALHRYAIAAESASTQAAPPLALPTAAGIGNTEMAMRN